MLGFTGPRWRSLFADEARGLAEHTAFPPEGHPHLFLSSGLDVYVDGLQLGTLTICKMGTIKPSPPGGKQLVGPDQQVTPRAVLAPCSPGRPLVLLGGSPSCLGSLGRGAGAAAAPRAVRYSPAQPWERNSGW